jgi:hypothetical protein
MKVGTTFALLCVCVAPAAMPAQQLPFNESMRAQQPPLIKSIPVGAHALTVTQTDTKAFAVHVTSSDTPSHVVRDILIGTVAGAAAGVLIGSQTNKGSKEDRELAGLAGGVLGAGVGALLGAAVGVAHKSAR